MFRKDMAVRFLESQYNPKIGLLREAPQVHPNLYWIWIDNWVAYEALLQYGEMDLAEKIEQGLKKYKDVPRHNRMEVLFKSPVQDKWRVGVHNEIDVIGEATIKSEICDGAVYEFYKNYADLTLLRGIAYINKRGIINRWRALSHLWTATNMWRNGGFQDVIYKESGIYATYKLALYKILSDRLGIKLSIYDDVVWVLNKLQDKTTGGIWTDYVTSRGRTGCIVVDPAPCDVNTETTAIVMLAMK